MTKFGRGNKVRVMKDTFSYYGYTISKGRLGTVSGALGSDPSWVLVVFSDGYDKYIHQDSLELVVETAQSNVISFDDVKRGDRLRYTRKYSDDDILVREFVVGGISANYIDSLYALPAGGFSVSRTGMASGDGTLELLSRPKEDLKVGDVVSTLEDFKRLPDNSVVKHVTPRSGLTFIVDAPRKRFIRLMDYTFDYEARLGNKYEIVSIP